jgi:hypothetical protein
MELRVEGGRGEGEWKGGNGREEWLIEYRVLGGRGVRVGRGMFILFARWIRSISSGKGNDWGIVGWSRDWGLGVWALEVWGEVRGAVRLYRMHWVAFGVGIDVMDWGYNVQIIEMENRFGGMISVEMVEVVGCIDGFAREAIALNIPLHTVQSLPSDLTLYSRANVIIHQYTSPCSPTESCPLKSSSGSAPAANHQLASTVFNPDSVFVCWKTYNILDFLVPLEFVLGEAQCFFTGIGIWDPSSAADDGAP